MPEHMARFRSWPFLTLAAALVYFAAGGHPPAAARPRTPPGAKPYFRQALQPVVRSQTKAFEVVGIAQENDSYVVSLRNVSDKGVNGYSIATGAHDTAVTDLTIGERVIAPGEVIEERIPRSRFQHTAPQQPTITILAVFFENGVGDGDAGAIAETKQRRLGAKIQLQRVRALLAEALASPAGGGNESDAAGAPLNKLKARIAALPEEPEGGSPPRVGSGLRAIKQDLLAELEKAGATGADARNHLIEIKERVVRRLGRLAP